MNPQLDVKIRNRRSLVLKYFPKPNRNEASKREELKKKFREVYTAAEIAMKEGRALTDAQLRNLKQGGNSD